MEVFVPKYYEKFKCIAERCTHSCCVGWEIDVDEKTFARHDASEHPLSRELLSVTSECDGVKYIELCESGRCPFLDGCGLCRIISELGEEYTSRICREHPRFYHRIGERVECGIGAVCEEAASIILSSDCYDSFVKISREACDTASGDECALIHRSEIFTLLRSHSLSDAVASICEKYGINITALSGQRISDAVAELELLDEGHRDMLAKVSFSFSSFTEEYLKRFLAYLVFRHVSVSESEDMIAARVAFSLLLLGIFSGNICEPCECDFRRAADVARIISEEIEYSEENIDALIFELYSLM